MKGRNEYTCPLELTHELTRGKWKPILLWQLGKGQPLQPSQLEKGINGIGQKMLLEQLAQLVEAGLVSKKTSGSYPLRSEYAITSRGLKTLEAITIMQEIGVEVMLERGMEEPLRQAGLIP